MALYGKCGDLNVHIVLIAEYRPEAADAEDNIWSTRGDMLPAPR